MAEETEKPAETAGTTEQAEAAGTTEQVAKPEQAPQPEQTGEAGKAEATAEAPAPQEPAEAAAQPAADRRGRGRGARQVPAGVAHIKATFNNTMVTLSDMHGGVVAWSSGGKAGFKGSRKSTSFAATLVGQDAARQAVSRGMHEVEVHVQGAGAGRESAIRALQSSGLNITVIKDVTPIPHNGCRPRKRRRV